MVKGPAVIIVVRHGARLDAANRDWHLTSPEPYNAPLTYGGWNQAKALGARIASLLKLREDGLLDSDDLKEKLTGYCIDGQNVAVTTNGSGTEKKRNRRRKHRLVLHTSPYLRCVQTSIGISAGIASTKKAPKKKSTASQLADLSLSSDPMNVAVQDYASGPVDNQPTPAPGRPLLRVDALLGEWMNPEYYEGMISPPDSATMVVGAKAELLRRGEPVEITIGRSINRGNFPGGWSSSLARSSTLARQPPYQLTAGSLPMDISSRDGTRSRSSSVSSVDSSTSHSSRRGGRTKKRSVAAYRAPVPRYAVAPTDMIPLGFVAHARDACVDIDFQWDSMRAPQEWGDGGELGEEWGTMHKRLRYGFQKMIKWYRAHPVDSILDEQPLAYPDDDGTAMPSGEDDDEDDLVLVLVTHGAACNALLGALTNQPVLLDVGMASLTMAVRKESACRPPAPDRSHTVHGEMDLSKRRRSSVEFGLSRDYEMKLIASTDHLRTGTDPSRPPVRSRQNGTTNSDPKTGLAGSPENSTTTGRSSNNAALGSVRRNNTTSGGSRPSSRRYASPSPERPRTTSRAGTASTNGGGGLWSSRTPTTQATTPATLPDSLSDLGDSPIGPGDGEGGFSLGASLQPAVDEASIQQLEKSMERVRFKDIPFNYEDEDVLSPLHSPTSTIPGSQGLWGPGGGGRGVPQRRWTIDQRG